MPLTTSGRVRLSRSLLPFSGSGWSAKRSPRKSASSRRWPWIMVPVAPSRIRILSASRRSRVSRTAALTPSSLARRRRLPPGGTPPGEEVGDERTGQDAGEDDGHRGVADRLVVERHGDDAQDGGQQAGGHQPDGLLRARRQAAQPAHHAAPSSARVITRAELCPPRPKEVDIATRRSAGRAMLATW